MSPARSGAQSRSAVITGAARGLGLASAARLYRDGWTVVAAMRSVEAGMANLRHVTGAAERDPRIIGVALDLTDPVSIERAAAAIQESVGAPDALIHNAGISAAGMAEETPADVWDRMFATSVTGPVALTSALLPSMRAAGGGRIVLVSSQAAVRGMPATAPYAAVKAAMERWGEALAGETAPFGIGVTILVTGTYETDIITDAGTIDCRDLHGPYAPHHRTMDARGRKAMKSAARSPGKFADGLAAALETGRPFTRRAIGPDARMLLIANRLLPAAGMHHLTRMMLGIPRFGALRHGSNR
ncbi:SDR family NAD(P)-dependent oxidoreductase [Nocardia sp. NPDC058499]|uniref:SDR family NAD(P)-dependent oxidoreductase n=1 Tax=Nocardia sp. NPDC058499 TaxID=3346530 RepID=UPI00365FD816